MLEFLTENFNFITYGFEIIAALIGLLCIQKYKRTTTIYFIGFLVYIVFVELIGAALVYYQEFPPISLLRTMGVRITNWFNLFWLFGSIIFIFYYYHSLLHVLINKIILRIVIVAFTIIMLSHFLIQIDIFINARPIFYQLLGAMVTSICIIIYFIELLKSEAILYVFKSFAFYASVGLLIWWLVITPVIFFDQYNTVNDWDFANLKRRIFLSANIFMYTCFSIGLLISKPKITHV